MVSGLEPLSYYPYIKILGITFDNRMTFTKHFEEILERCNQKFHCLRILVNKKWGSPYKDKAGPALIVDWDLENIMTFVFSGFSFILYLAHHLASLSRSLCRYSAAKSIFLLTAPWPASSANCDLLVWSWVGFGMSLT